MIDTPSKIPPSGPQRPPAKPLYGISFIPSNTVYPIRGLKHEPNTIEWIWGMFNTFPRSRPQLRNSQNATARILKWRSKLVLPPRRAYLSTVDYYEAYEPLYRARARFERFIEPNSLMVSLTQALKTLLPKPRF